MLAARLALVACLALAAAARGQSLPPPGAAGDTLRLALGDCVRRALAVGEEMRLAEADLAAARGAYLEARSDVFPHLTLGSTYTRQFESVFRESGDFGIEPFVADTLAALERRVRDLEVALPTAPLASLSGLFDSGPFGSEHSWDVRLGLEQKLFEGGSIWAAVQVARHGLRSVELRREDREREVRMLTGEAYLGALLAEREFEIASLALQQADTQLQRVRSRRDAGQAAEFDLLQAEVQRDNQLPVIKAAANQRAVAYLQLAGIANLPIGVPLRLTSALLAEQVLPVDSVAAVDTTAIFAAALQSARIVAIEEEVAARSRAVTVAGRDAWPALSLFANYSEQAYPADFLPSRDEWRRDVSAGMRLSWAVFDGFRTRGLKQMARAEFSRSQQEMQRDRETIQLLVARELGDLERAVADLRARSRTVQVAHRAFELATLRYDEGASSLLEVEDARLALQVAQVSEARARHDACVALSRLERYTGRPLFTDLVRSRLGEGS